MNLNTTDCEQILQGIIDALPQHIAVLDETGKIVQINNNWQNLNSFLSKNVNVGDNLLTFLSDEFGKDFNEINQILSVETVNFETEFQILSENNQVWFQFRATSANLSNSFRIIVYIEDITVHKQTELALLESEESYRTLAETVSDVIIKIDETGKIIFINHAAQKIFGYDHFEIIGQPLEMLMPAAMREFHKEGLLNYLTNREKQENSSSFEIPAQHINGNIFPLEISFGEFEQSGKQYFIGIARDISERKSNEKANSLLASIVESSEDAIVSKDLNGTITSWNKGAELLYGYTADETIGKPISMLIPKFLPKEETVILDRIKKGERVEHFETLRQNKNGSILNISLTVSPILNEKGEIVGASKIARDITEKHRSAEELKQSQLMLSLAMQSSKMGVWENDIASDVVHWSKELEEIFGLESGSFGKSREAFYSLVHEEDRTQIWAEVQTAIAEKRDYTIEFRFFHTDGTLRWMEGRGKAVYSDKGEPVRVYGIGIDITDRKKSEANLRESEERYRTLFNSVDEGFCIIEMIFDEKNTPIDYRFIEINPMFEKLTGLENALGKTARELAPDLESHWFEIYGNVALTGESLRFTQNSEALNRWFDVYAVRLGDENSCRVALIFSNITDRKLIEQQREEILQREIAARKTAEEANRAKDDFLSVLSHELRTPLNAILGWTRVLSMSALDEERKLKAIETIERNARLQKNLIEDLLDVSRIISGKMRIEKEELDFISIVNSAVEMVRPLAESKNINIEFLSEIESQKLNGDTTRLNQIVVNLVNNAVKFTPEKGTVKLLLTVINNKLRLDVIDSGIGISPDFLPFMFDRFRQADSTIVRNHSGLGLGLTIVRHLTELHGGTVFAHSEGTGKGATFSLELPLFENRSNEQDIESPEILNNILNPYNFSGKTILLVDDDHDGIEPIQVLLENHGAETVCVNSANEALNAARSKQFDLMLSDIGMPETDGFQLIQMMQKSNDINSFPAIALTAYASAEDRQKALSAGFQQHLSKPVDFEILLKTISNIFNNETD